MENITLLDCLVYYAMGYEITLENGQVTELSKGVEIWN